MRVPNALYLLIAAVTIYLVRALPLTLIRTEIKSPFIRSFLYYVPYVTLSVMTFPAILYATGSVWSAAAGLAAAAAAAWFDRGLFGVALTGCAAVFLSELLLL